MIRTILSPGVELKETDKSQYTSDIGSTPRALVMGFASHGPDKVISEITSMTDFRTLYGTPTNEVERYFYNAADQMIAAGATVIASKIPYDGNDKLVGVKYTFDSNFSKDIDDLDVDRFIEMFDRSISTSVSLDPSASLSTDYATIAKRELSATDSTITKLKSFYGDKLVTMTNEDFNNLESGDRSSTNISSSFIIVDKTRSVYKTFTGNGSNIDCLGILPVVTTAANAMAIAQEISSVNMDATSESDISTYVNAFEPLSDIDYISGDNNTESEWKATRSEISGYWSIGPKTIANRNTLNSISKIASQFFPAVNYSSSSTIDPNDGVIPFDHNYFSYIGIVVFKIGVDRGSGCLVAEPVESFAGSLIKSATDLRTNASAFIENIVNTTSNYISIYVADDIAKQTNSNVKLDKNSILYAYPSPGLILGIPPKAVQNKKVSTKNISDCMDAVFNSQSNILGSTLDVVVDAGLSTIFEYVSKIHDSSEDASNHKYDAEKIFNESNTNVDQLNSPKDIGGWTGWRTIVNKMKAFCETTRKDCAFVCDAPRFLSLKNQRKLVNSYDTSKSVANDILPNIKYISGINTSYGWGYTPWFKIGDAADGTAFWCPPSIFGANRYIITRTRWNVWDAPAGMTRGAISVDDTSFEPDLNARNVIYSNGWNYALTDVQNGVTTLEGQKTFQSYQSALDRINVRSLFLDIERRVFRIARKYIYEPNTSDTRQQFIDDISPIFSTLKAQGGCYDYKIIADESINTPQVIDNNEFRFRIGVQPTKLMEFILGEFVVSRTGSNWSELVME